MSPLVAYFLLVNCVLFPYMAVESARKLHRNPPPEMPRRKLYLLTILRLTLLTAFGLFVAKDVGLILFRPWSPTLIEIAVGLVLLAGWFGLREMMVPWIRKATPPNSFVRMPATLRQLALWACVSVTAGVGEEILYRGVIYDCLVWWIHLPIAAALISAAVFSILHINQGYRSAGFIFFVALSMQALVGIAGSLYMAMIVHTTFDFAVGLRYVLAKDSARAIRA